MFVWAHQQTSCSWQLTYFLPGPGLSLFLAALASVMAKIVLMDVKRATDMTDSTTVQSMHLSSVCLNKNVER
jgi:hypothetical protein